MLKFALVNKIKRLWLEAEIYAWVIVNYNNKNITIFIYIWFTCIVFSVFVNTEVLPRPFLFLSVAVLRLNNQNKESCEIKPKPYKTLRVLWCLRAYKLFLCPAVRHGVLFKFILLCGSINYSAEQEISVSLWFLLISLDKVEASSVTMCPQTSLTLMSFLM